MSKVVRIDPGHGGPDPGAVANGLREADVVLEIARLTAGMVRMGGANVGLTRTRDVGLEPRHRSQALSRPGAHCAVSIHANAAVRGDGSSDPAARGHECFVSAFLPESRRLGDCISASLGARVTAIPPRKPAVKTRLTEDGRDWYYVVRDPVAAGIPAVLVEVGFITSPEDAAHLASFWGRFQVAYAVASGVLCWLGIDVEEAGTELADARARLAEIRRIASGGGE